MGKLFLALFILSINNSFSREHNIPLDLTLAESQRMYSMLKKNKSIQIKDKNILSAIKGGEKLLLWIKKINEQRDQANKLRLTSKEDSSGGIPIEKPSKYGPTTIKADLEKIKAEIPLSLFNIIYAKAHISAKNPLSDVEFIKWGKKVSRLYQTAVRLSGMTPWLEYYAKRKARDIRGFYYLKNIDDLDIYLSTVDSLSTKEKNKIIDALLGICINNYQTEKFCQKSLAKFSKHNKFLEFKNKYWKLAQSNWDSFFKITDPRKDIIWRASAPGVMEIVFKDPHNEEIAHWLKENIEDEFRLVDMNWLLEMKFIKGKWGTAYLEFKKNTTPHVAGGNKIVMDANTDIEEYGVKWTIRHEYGHILRLPDCYHEFYDKEQNLMINYQLDVKDLMCSRAGAMNKRIYDELKRVYLRK